MLKDERLRVLSQALAKQNVMRLRDAAALLEVSEMTVRRDVAANPERFTYLGGYIVSATDVPNTPGYSLDAEKDHFSQAKAEPRRTRRSSWPATKPCSWIAAPRSPRSPG